MTLTLLLDPNLSIPKLTSIYLSDLSEFRGKQDLYERQSPQRLRLLYEHALIESSISSNRIEGVTIEPNRMGTVIFGKPLLKGRDEEEIQGYRNALQWIHQDAVQIAFNEITVKHIHKHNKGDQWDSGEYRSKDTQIIEHLPGGNTRVRFTPVSGDDTQQAMNVFFQTFDIASREDLLHPLLCIAAANLDFLCIHPFRDGNGRVSRLLLLLQLYHCGFNVGRYISLERLIEENKQQYYETLEYCSKKWIEGKNDFWPYINFLLGILKKAYQLMEKRSGEYADFAKGEKTLVVERAIESAPDEFTISYLESVSIGISRELIRKVLKEYKRLGKVEPLRKGPNTPWKKR